ncbi:hypothetical protein Q4566_12510 [Tamlana sp. 2_MG-2023]|uniref:hypothetical protein n=1 Tax=unclassified Tamlana TaxID=2614803 RepID=UPI0026E2F4B0|nr:MULTISPECIES: hypothetical protein [unclassified Tamlana]MDO6761026.1 hypothetical protein [Tamlana sp. 2_MG-2023]MDO6791641.1 hypothetical protein [Tamlana sp. 1_MG-2023]
MKTRLVIFVFTLFSFVQGHAQCAMCRAVLESEEGQSTAEGINDGIVYLMAFPYILVAGMIYFVYKKYNTLKK